MTKPRNTKIAQTFMLAECWDSYTPPRSALVMPKLNGLRAMWVPGEGWFSRDGVKYSDAVLGHIKVDSKIPVDGELYVHGWSLQQINSAVGVNLLAPVEDSARVQFHVFDVVSTMALLHTRLMKAAQVVAHSSNLVLVDFEVLSQPWFDPFTQYIRDGYEGAMYKSLNMPYIPGRTTALLKRKDWKYMDVRVIGIKEGLGKFANMFGGADVVAIHDPTLTFNVGVGKALTDTMRRAIWKNPDTIIGKVFTARYLNLSDDGKPLNPTIKLTL